MIAEVKRALAREPERIRQLLEEYGFAHIAYRGNEFRCARNRDGNPTAISIRLNDSLSCIDYVTSESHDLFAMIASVKGVSNGDVVRRAIAIADIGEIDTQMPVQVDNTHIKKELKTRQCAELDAYPRAFSMMFLKDHISLSAQMEFDIRYDFESNRIVIPIYSPAGELIGAKGRANFPVTSTDAKYLYLLPCAASETLYGLSHNRDALKNQTVIICESEKSVMQAFSYGRRDFVGIGSNHLSETQCALIASLTPRNIVLALDQGLDKRVIEENVENLLPVAKRQYSKLYIWEPSAGIPEKASLTDMGQEELERILKEEIVKVGDSVG